MIEVALTAVRALVSRDNLEGIRYHYRQVQLYPDHVGDEMAMIGDAVVPHGCPHRRTIVEKFDRLGMVESGEVWQSWEGRRWEHCHNIE